MIKDSLYANSILNKINNIHGSKTTQSNIKPIKDKEVKHNDEPITFNPMSDDIMK
jgi:hypothetical protein